MLHVSKPFPPKDEWLKKKCSLMGDKGFSNEALGYFSGASRFVATSSRALSYERQEEPRQATRGAILQPADFLLP